MKKIWAFLSFTFIISHCVAQKSKQREDLLYKQLQQFADTTYVIEINSKGTTANQSDHYFLSKKDNMINIYYYGDPLKGIVMPKEIAGRLKYAGALDTTQMSINLRFSPERISKGDALRFWNGLKMLQPWEIKEVVNDSCSQIYDGWSLKFKIIVKDNIKTISFDNPDSYEKHCPGNLNRQTILKIYDSFLLFFGRKQ